MAAPISPPYGETATPISLGFGSVLSLSAASSPLAKESEACEAFSTGDVWTDRSTEPSLTAIKATIDVSQFLQPLELKVHSRLEALEAQVACLRDAELGSSRSDASAASARAHALERRLEEELELWRGEASRLNESLAQAIARTDALEAAFQPSSGHCSKESFSATSSFGLASAKSIGSSGGLPSMEAHAQALQEQMQVTVGSLQSFFDTEATKISELAAGVQRCSNATATLQQNVDEVWRQLKADRTDSRRKHQELADDLDRRLCCIASKIDAACGSPAASPHLAAQRSPGAVSPDHAGPASPATVAAEDQPLGSPQHSVGPHVSTMRRRPMGTTAPVRQRPSPQQTAPLSKPVGGQRSSPREEPVDVPSLKSPVAIRGGNSSPASSHRAVRSPGRMSPLR